MRVFNKNKKYVMIGAIVGAFLPMGFLFTNMKSSGPTTLSVSQLAEESARIQKIITSNDDQVVKKKLGKFKRYLGQRLARELRAQNCLELVSVDPSLQSGVYGLYPDTKSDKPSFHYCQVESGRVVSDLPVDHLMASVASSADDSCRGKRGRKMECRKRGESGSRKPIQRGSKGR